MITRILMKTRWVSKAKELKHVGKDSYVGRNFSIHGPEFIDIGDKFRAGRNLKLQAWEFYHGKKTGTNPALSIGDNVTFMENVQISCLNSIVIGSGTLLGDNVFISDNSHGDSKSLEDRDIPPLERKLFSKGSIKIGENVWIGRNACIIGSVEIGRGAIIGANAVVTNDIPPYCTAVGVPARVLLRKE